jgi:hypothetical protein
VRERGHGRAYAPDREFVGAGLPALRHRSVGANLPALFEAMRKRDQGRAYAPDREFVGAGLPALHHPFVEANLPALRETIRVLPSPQSSARKHAWRFIDRIFFARGDSRRPVAPTSLRR